MLSSLLLVLLATAATAPGATTTDPAATSIALPERLADTGLYADFDAGTVAADVLAYAPQYPLWTDGARKRRFIKLPPGAAIDASDPDAWLFPIGTKLWKEFSFERKVETRYMERGADGRWIFASYVWSADGRDARLAPERGVKGACEIRPGVRFDIPGRLDCLACHEGGASVVLGFSALQLSSDRDPLAPHAEAAAAGGVDLALLVRRGLVRGLAREFVDQAPRIAARSGEERAALGYLHANCGHCHNASGPLANLGLALDWRLARRRDAAAPAIATALGVASRFRGSCRSEPVRIVAGDPGQSTLVARLATRNPLVQMPPLGTRVVDEEARDLIAAWIREELGSPRDGTASSASTPPPNPRSKE